MLQRDAFCAERAVNLGVDSLQHAIDIFVNFIVPDSKNAEAFLFQPPCASFIAQFVLLVAVSLAIEFDEQTCGHAGEIGDVRADRNLSAAMRTLEFESPQVTPDPLLCVSRCSAKPTRF